MTYGELVVVDACSMALVTEGEQGLSALVDLLDHEHAGIRNMAFLGIGLLDRSSAWALPQLIRALSEDPAGTKKSTIIFALGQIGGAEAKATLQSLVEHLTASEGENQTLLRATEDALARCD